MFPSPALDQLLTEMNVLPVELKRNLVLMRTLSEELTEVSHRVDKYADYYFSPKCLVRERSKTIAKANQLMTEVNDFGDDKVQLAVQTYEMVDKYIRKLDSTLVRLESARQDKIHVGISRKELIRAIIKGKQVSMANGIKTTDLDHINTALANTSINDHKPILMNTLNPVYRGSMKVRSEKSNQLLDMPVDPNEPRFCSCQQVSFGQMIGCDNTNCPTEWFHFSCVKLTQTPKGKWFCPQCKTKKNTITKKIS